MEVGRPPSRILRFLPERSYPQVGIVVKNGGQATTPGYGSGRQLKPRLRLAITLTAQRLAFACLLLFGIERFSDSAHDPSYGRSSVLCHSVASFMSHRTYPAWLN